MALTKSRPGYQPDAFQEEAIACRDKGIRIVAPAGSGKTQTLARRVAARIESGIDPQRILVVTFDNNARKSLEGFIRDALPARRSVSIRTLNQVGKDILRRHFSAEHRQIIAQQSDQMREMVSYFQGHAAELPVLEWDGVRRKVLDVFEALKNQGFQPGNASDIDVQTRWLRREYLRLPDLDESATLDDFWGMPTGAIGTDAYAGQIHRILELYAEHDRYLRARGVMTLTDQKSRAFFSLQANHRVRDEIRSSYDEVIVDECQDINRLDACLIWAIVGHDTTLVLAGDDDQTLYEFRNAHSLYLREPERFFRDRAFTTIHLNINYRSPQSILEPAVTLIRHNVERIDKSPQSGVAEMGEVFLLPAESMTEEGRYIVRHLQKLLSAGGRSGNGYRMRDVVFLCHDDSTRKWTEGILRSARVPLFNDDRRRGPLVDDGVEVITFRKAKGRQWPVVFLPNSNDRLLPDDQSIREGRLESVRRMYYVAMTRAARQLVISYVRAGDHDVIHRTAGGEVIGTNGGSRFLFEAGLADNAPSEEPMVPEPEPVAQIQPIPVEPVKLAPEPLQTDQPLPPSQTPAPSEPVNAQVVVQPVPSSPGEAPPPGTPVRKRATKPWELRQPELQSLQKATSLWEQGDYEFAVFKAWTPLERVVSRVVKLSPGTDDRSMVRLISHALDSGAIESSWADQLHKWRKVRNLVYHEGGEVLTRSASVQQDAFSLVQRAPDFLAYLAERVAPKQFLLETHDDYLQKLVRLVERIASGQPLPRTGRPLKAIRFDPDREALEMIPFQFLMVLRDVRFYTPDEYRWTSAPVIGRLLVDTLGGIPAGIRPRGTHATGKAGKPDEDRIYGQLVRLLELDAGDDHPRAFLQRAVDDAVRAGNGNFHAGLKLNPRRLSS